MRSECVCACRPRRESGRAAGRHQALGIAVLPGGSDSGHADPDMMRGQQLSVGGRRILDALIGVMNLRHLFPHGDT